LERCAMQVSMGYGGPQGADTRFVLGLNLTFSVPES